MPVATRSRWLFVASLILSMSTLACGFVGGAFSPTAAAPGATLPPVAPQAGATPIAAQAISTPTQSLTPSPTMAANPIIGPIDSIVLIAPLPNQGVRQSIHIEGYSDLTFEQPLGILVRDAGGKVIASAAARIQTVARQRGKFSADVPLPMALPTQTGRVVVYSTSARDGGLTHLSSVDVQLNSDASPSVTAIDPNRVEAIVIDSPVPNATQQTIAHVSGVSDPTFEQTLIVEVRGQNTATLGRATTHINADVGQRGSFAVDVPFQVFGDPPGRIVVYAISPRDGKTVHLSSVEVNLQP
jgi:hypothetical protein